MRVARLVRAVSLSGRSGSIAVKATFVPIAITGGVLAEEAMWLFAE